MTLRLAVLISGRGTNLVAILDAIARGACDAHVALVVSDRPSAAGLAAAAARGIRTDVVRMADHASRAAWDEALALRVAEAEPELVVLAGFMRVVGPAFLSRFADRIINVHPALLPLFPGTDGPAQALAAKVRISGCSVHVVDAGIDTGPVLAQAAVRVLPDDSVESLHERIQRAEHRLLPEVIHAIARDAIRLSPTIALDGARDDGTMFCSPLFSQLDDPS